MPAVLHRCRYILSEVLLETNGGEKNSSYALSRRGSKGQGVRRFKERDRGVSH